MGLPGILSPLQVELFIIILLENWFLGPPCFLVAVKSKESLHFPRGFLRIFLASNTGYQPQCFYQPSLKIWRGRRHSLPPTSGVGSFLKKHACCTSAQEITKHHGNSIYFTGFYFILFYLIYVLCEIMCTLLVWHPAISALILTRDSSRNILGDGVFSVFFFPVSPFKKMSKVNLLFIYLCRTCSGCLRGNQERRKQSEKSGKVKW